MSSYCVGCGGSLTDGANFCSVCGKAVTNRVHPPGRTLIRPRIGRKFAGVCQGLADFYGWDVSVTRIVAVLLIIVTFPVGLLVYGACRLIVPEEPMVSPSTTSLQTTGSS